MTPDEFRAALERLRLTTRDQQAEALGTTTRSIHRWLTGERAIPGPVVALVAALERLTA